MFDTWLPDSKDHLPLTWWKQHPVYLSALIALVGAASMVVFAILGPQVMVSWAAFSVESLYAGKVWTLVTHVLANGLSIWEIVGCLLLWIVGSVVERDLGRRHFVGMLVLLTLSVPVMIIILHLLGVRGLAAAGMGNIVSAVFVAFAALHPHAKMNLLIVEIDAWIMAAIFVSLSALQNSSKPNWTGLLLLGVNVGLAYLFIRREKGELRLPSFSFAKHRPAPRPVRKAGSAPRTNSGGETSGSTAPRKTSTAKAAPTVDEILDKISHQGMHSLTPEERRILDKASEEMRKRS